MDSSTPEPNRSQAMRIDLVTAVPDLVASPLSTSILGRAQRASRVQINVIDLREFGEGVHRQIDDYAFGGGAGMVIKPEPVFRCLDALRSEEPPIDDVIFLTPDAPILTQSIATELSLKARIVLVSGHYKGIDQRVRDELVTRELSIGPYVLSGGELPALVLIDAIVRLLPGSLGNAESAMTDSFQDGLLGAPVYTRPAVYRGLAVPEVLRSGDHDAIDEWRENQRISRTRSIRPDLLDD